MYAAMDNGLAMHNILPVFVGVESCDGTKVKNNWEITAKIRNGTIQFIWWQSTRAYNLIIVYMQYSK